MSDINRDYLYGNGSIEEVSVFIGSEQEFNAFIIDKVFVEFVSKDCKACVLAEPFLVEIKNSYPFSVAIVDITIIPTVRVKSELIYYIIIYS